MLSEIGSFAPIAFTCVLSTTYCANQVTLKFFCCLFESFTHICQNTTLSKNMPQESANSDRSKGWSRDCLTRRSSRYCKWDVPCKKYPNESWSSDAVDVGRISLWVRRSDVCEAFWWYDRWRQELVVYDHNYFERDTALGARSGDGRCWTDGVWGT